jgi:hypothetical protein
MDGRSQMQGGKKTGFCRKRQMQTSSYETLIGRKSGTTYGPLWDRNKMEGAWLTGYGLSSGDERSYNSPLSNSCLPFICSMTTSTLVSPLAFSELCVCVYVKGGRGRVPPDVIMSSVGGG